MPYVDPKIRNLLDVTFRPQSEGELNYTLTKICDEYLRYKGVNYPTINAVIGALECCKQELYRRVAAPYEDAAMERNGDVYTTTTSAVPRP